MGKPEVSSDDLRKEVEKILKGANLSKISLKKIRQKLEKKYDTDLTDRKQEIEKIVANFMEDKCDEESEEEKVLRPQKRSATKQKKPSRKAKASDSDDDGDDDEEEEEVEKKKAKKKGGGRGKGSGYTKPIKLSPALADIMGEEELPRHEVVKRMWALIKEKNLYDPSNKRFAICDEALYKVIGTKRFMIFGMMKYLKSHFIDD